jgi:hypothetical protein
VDGSQIVTDITVLEALYGEPKEAAVLKEVDHVHPLYRRWIEASPFVVLATSGPGGLDASPRGDAPGFVAVEDERTLLIPDRAGNNRIDTLRNILADPRVGLLFLVPGIGETLRVNGTATISLDPALKRRFAVAGKEPRSVLVVKVETVFFQCSRALVRSALWDPSKLLPRSALPSAGEVLAATSKGRIGGASYDIGIEERVKATLY